MRSNGGGAIWLGLLAAAGLACGDDSGHGSDAGDAAADGETIGPCEPATACLPFARSCAADGTPTECSETGDRWVPAAPCVAGQTCDPETGWCECGSCEVPTADGCERVGAECLDGWVDDGECGCRPTLGLGGAADANYGCAEDEIASIGGGCEPVGVREECGTGTWGAIPTDAGTIYVNGAYAGGDGDGSRDRPFTTLQAAFDAVPAAVAEPCTIAVAAGSYVENATAARPVRLVGVCASRVTVVGLRGTRSVLLLQGDGSSVEGLTVDGGRGVLAGIEFPGPGSGSASRVRVRRSRDFGIYGENVALSVRETTVEDIDPDRTSAQGDGIVSRGDGSSCSLTLDRVDLQRIGRTGVGTGECTLAAARLRVRAAGYPGLMVQNFREDVPVTVEDGVFEDVAAAGIVLAAGLTGGASGSRLERNRIVRTLPLADYPAGQGGIVATGSADAAGGAIAVSENWVGDSDVSGIQVIGLAAVVTGNRVEDAGSQGMFVELPDTAGAVSGNTVRGGADFGLLASRGAPARVERNAVSGVRPGTVTAHAVGLQIQRGTGGVLRGNVSTDQEVGAVILETAGELSVAGNLLRPSLLGVVAKCGTAPLAAELSGNRVASGMIGLQVGRNEGCMGSRFVLADNRVGPLAAPLPDAGVEITAAIGLHGHLCDTLLVEDNRVFVRPVAGTWSFGVSVVRAAAELRGNVLVGAQTAAIQLATLGEADLPATIADNLIVGGGGVGLFVERFGTTTAARVERNRIVGVGAGLWPNGTQYGDGVVTCGGVVELRDNRLWLNARAGLFAAGETVAVQASGNDIRANAWSAAWQDGAEVELADNAVSCNGSDQPLEEGGLAVPDPPDPSLPAM